MVYRAKVERPKAGRRGEGGRRELPNSSDSQDYNGVRVGSAAKDKLPGLSGWREEPSHEGETEARELMHCR